MFHVCLPVHPSSVSKATEVACPCCLLCLYICQDNMLSFLKNANALLAVRSSPVNKYIEVKTVPNTHLI